MIYLTNCHLPSRTRSCLTLLGCAGAAFCSVGFINAFGVFQAYYSETLLSNMSNSDIGWIGAINNFLLFAGSVVTGRILDMFGAVVSLILPEKRTETDMTIECS